MRVSLPPFLIWIWVAVAGFYISRAFILNAFKILIMTSQKCTCCTMLNSKGGLHIQANNSTSLRQ